MITKVRHAQRLQSLLQFAMIGLWLTIWTASAQPWPGAPGRRTKIELGSYYQAEDCSASSVRHGWSLPVDVLALPHAQRISAALSLDENAQMAIARNGLVVVPFGPHTNMIETYRLLREQGVNAFVTSDTLLHLYHVQFGDVLRCVETNEFYAKQSYTPVVTSIPPTPENSYVEPVPEFWSRLLALTRMTRTGLTALEVLNSTQANRLLAMEEILGRLKVMAMTELAGQPLSAADCAYINHFDEALAPLTNGIADGLDIGTTLVADVHTDGNTAQVLEEGVGFVRLLVAACPVPGGQTVLCVGPVFSYYEFKWPSNDRLTDEAWAGLLAAEQAPPEPPWTRHCAWPVVLPPEDADGDRLADSWEQTLWGGVTIVNAPDHDPDGDGLSNAQELQAATNPQDPESCLRVTSLQTADDGIQLQWRSVPDIRYRVFYSEDLHNWYVLQTPITAQGPTTSLTDPTLPWVKCRFYRVAVVP